MALYIPNGVPAMANDKGIENTTPSANIPATV